MGTVKTFKQFSIPFTGLKPGKHEFSYEITDAFFEDFEYSLVKKGNIRLELLFDKQQEMMFILHFHFSGTAILTCERCLDPYVFPVESNEKLILRTGEEEFDDPEIMVIPRNVHEIDISPLVYEYINLALPLIHQHPKDEEGEPSCSNETALILKNLRNDEQQGLVHNLYPLSPQSSLSPAQGEEKSDSDIDPRWEALKNIKNINL